MLPTMVAAFFLLSAELRSGGRGYKGASLIRNGLPLEPYSRSMLRPLWWSYGVTLFIMSEVPLYGVKGGMICRRHFNFGLRDLGLGFHGQGFGG